MASRRGSRPALPSRRRRSLRQVDDHSVQPCSCASSPRAAGQPGSRAAGQPSVNSASSLVTRARVWLFVKAVARRRAPAGRPTASTDSSPGGSRAASHPTPARHARPEPQFLRQALPWIPVCSTYRNPHSTSDTIHGNVPTPGRTLNHRPGHVFRGSFPTERQLSGRLQSVHRGTSPSDCGPALEQATQSWPNVQREYERTPPGATPWKCSTSHLDIAFPETFRRGVGPRRARPNCGAGRLPRAR